MKRLVPGGSITWTSFQLLDSKKKKKSLNKRQSFQLVVFWPLTIQGLCWWSQSTVAMATCSTSCGVGLRTSWHPWWLWMKYRKRLSIRTWRPSTPGSAGVTPLSFRASVFHAAHTCALYYHHSLLEERKGWVCLSTPTVTDCESLRTDQMLIPK